MAAPAPTGLQRRAAFSFRGTDSEMDRSAPLAPGETVVLHGGLRAREHGLVRSPAVVRLTDRRLVVVRHFAFHPDRMWEVPLPAVESVDAVGAGLAIGYRDRDSGTAVIRLTPWSGRNPLARPLRDLTELADALRASTGTSA